MGVGPAEIARRGAVDVLGGAYVSARLVELPEVMLEPRDRLDEEGMLMVPPGETLPRESRVLWRSSTEGDGGVGVMGSIPFSSGDTVTVHAPILASSSLRFRASRADRLES